MTIKINMNKAKDIWRNQIRKEREPLLSKLDIEYQKADEAGNIEEKKRIAAEKQRLRDAPADPSIESAATPEELKKVWPL